MSTPFRRSWAAVLVGLAVLLSAPSVAGASSDRSLSSASVPRCGGQWLVRASGGLWRCSFDDEFNGSSLDTTKWVPQQTALSGFHSGAECFVNSPSNISESDGTLNLTVRAKLPSATVRGLQESFWLRPQNATRYGATWPDSGEIDLAEAYSGLHRGLDDEHDHHLVRRGHLPGRQLEPVRPDQAGAVRPAVHARADPRPRHRHQRPRPVDHATARHHADRLCPRLEVTTPADRSSRRAGRMAA